MVELKGFTTPDCKMFCFSYEHDGRSWGINIPCYDRADAEARARLLNLKLDGELIGECPVKDDGTPDLDSFQWEPGHGPDEVDPADVTPEYGIGAFSENDEWKN